jgi:hypothetical protein
MQYAVCSIYADMINRARRTMEAEGQFTTLLSESPPATWHMVKKGQVLSIHTD